MVKRFFLTLGLLALSSLPKSSPLVTISFETPIDAVSITMGYNDRIELRALGGKWAELEIEKEFDPLLRESNMRMFHKPTTHIQLRGDIDSITVQPIRVSHDPVSYQVAATSFLRPRIVSRSQWGADESLLVGSLRSSRSDVTINETTSKSSPRIEECQRLQREYPEEFSVSRTETKDSRGRRLRWSRRYSPKVSRLVVHHTALTVGTDSRPPVERMRALYTYHTNNRGWGDIGYHFVIDEHGTIYEGKSGGDYVVGGHVYCGNVGTVGIALMGNFEVEKPSQDQLASLKWLLDDLSERYDLPIDKPSRFHGKRTSPIVGHGDLISTVCPGYFLRETLSQIRTQTIAGTFSSTVNFPKLAKNYTDRTQRRLTSRLTRSSIIKRPETSVVGANEITVRPGGKTTVHLRHRTGPSSVPKNGRLENVKRSHPRIGVWQDGKRVRREITTPKFLKSGETVLIALTLQAPRESGSYDVKVGEAHIIVHAEGRRVRTPQATPTFQSFNRGETRNIRLGRRISEPRSSSRTQTRTTATPRTIASSPTIRIRLSYEGSSATIKTGSTTQTCTTGGTRRIGSLNSISTVTSWDTTLNTFRGVIECRTVDGSLALINEVSLEDYLKGLAEEPDSEPYEKQRAFAIAARSYAAHYSVGGYKKFPGKPYDGDDSPQRFQKYGGVKFEESNPEWVRAVQSTAHTVVVKDGDIIKTAYFSSDDGRTRSPEEKGWHGYPHSDVFASKPDPWCKGLPLWGHGVGMSGCGAKGQALEGKSAEDILNYYYPGTLLTPLSQLSSR